VRRLCWLVAAAAAATVAGCGEDCVWQDLFGPNFDCGGRGMLDPGEACWADAPGSGSRYGLEDHGIVWRGGLPCPPGTYCHTTLGCRPPEPSGGTCEGMAQDALYGMCADPREGCYPADPAPGSERGGPRVCRRLPEAEGAWCDATVKPDCDAYVRAGASLQFVGPEHAWQRLGRHENPGWSGQGWNGEHLLGGELAPGHYPVLRMAGLLCQDSRCTPPPAPGEPCAVLEPSATYPARGHLARVCAQPPAFTVAPDTFGEGVGAVRDFRHAVFCVAGVCTPREALPAGACFAQDAADDVLDPRMCSDWVESCALDAISCMSPCRPDGTCGLCAVCARRDGTREAVDSEAACPDDGEPWERWSGPLVVDSSLGLQCGYTLAHAFADVPPVSGALWLEVRPRGDFRDPEAALEVFVDDTFARRLSPARGCQPVGSWEPTPVIAFPLDAAAAEDGRVEVELRATRALCASCPAPSGCPGGRGCEGNDVELTLRDVVQRFIGRTRDDAVCGDVAPR
jgi:hypothetical protein